MRFRDRRVHFDLISIVIIVSVFAVFAFSGLMFYRQLAEAGQTHKALCAYKSDTEQRYEDSQKFLLMTPAQRAEKYGKQLAHIPEGTIKRGMEAQKSILDALSDLDC